jgi:hypothetical protein
VDAAVGVNPEVEGDRSHEPTRESESNDQQDAPLPATDVTTQQDLNTQEESGPVPDAGGEVNLTAEEVDYGGDEKEEEVQGTNEQGAADDMEEDEAVPTVGADPGTSSQDGGVATDQEPPSKKSKSGDVPPRKSPSTTAEAPSPSPEPRKRVYFPVGKKPSPPPLPEGAGVEPGTTAKNPPSPLPKSAGVDPGSGASSAPDPRPPLQRKLERILPDGQVRAIYGGPITSDRRRNLRTISKELSFLLRHGAEKYGLVIRPDGFVAVGPLQRVLVDKVRLTVSVHDLYEVVAHAEKMRFELMEGVPPGCRIAQLTHIRAISGHSMGSVDDGALLGKPTPEKICRKSSTMEPCFAAWSRSLRTG